MKAVLWDMDGTIVDSEKLWDVAINELYAKHDRVLSSETRDATVGGSADGVIRIVFDDLGLEPDQAHMDDVVDWMHDYVRGARVRANCSMPYGQPTCRWPW